jgi:hypothetical protein
MALKKLTLRPGINKEGTNYSNEDGFYNSDKIRFRSGYAEKIGGWSNTTPTYTFKGIARSLWAWVSLAGEKLLGVGTTQKFYVQNTNGSEYKDITPIQSISTLTTPYITITDGSLVATITCTNHGVAPNTFITITKATTTLTSAITATVSTPIAVVSTTNFPTSGTIQIDKEVITYVGKSGTALGTTSVARNIATAAPHAFNAEVISLESLPLGNQNMQGEFQVISVNGPNSFNVSLPITTVCSPSPLSGGSGAKMVVLLNAGGGAFSATSGWGASPWGFYGWGLGSVTSGATPVRLWSQTNFDQDLIFAPRLGSIYWWTKNTQTYQRAVTLNTEASTRNKATTKATYVTGSQYITVADNTGINTGATVTGSFIPTGAYVGSDYAGGLIVPIYLDPDTPATVNVTAVATTCATTINASFTGNVTFASVLNWPTDGGIFLAGAELIVYSAITGTAVTIVERGYGGTTATSHTASFAVTYHGDNSVGFSYSGKHVPVKTLLVTTSSQNAFTIAFGGTPYNPYVFSAVADFDPLLVRWSDQDNPWEWVPETTNQSGEQRLANGSVIVTAINTRQEILVWTDTAIYSMQYLGPPYVYGINLLMDNLSIASQNAAITVNNVTYWMGVDRFYQYSGRVETLACTLRQFVFGRINKNQLQQIQCGSNEGFNEIWWFYPSDNSPINDSYVVYNHLENLWYYGTISRTAWVDTQLQDYPLGAFSTEYTFLSRAISSTDGSIPVVSATSLPPSGIVLINSEQILYSAIDYTLNVLTVATNENGVIIGRGYNNTAAVSHLAYASVNYTTPNQVMYHEYGWDDASNTVVVPIYAYIDSSDFDIDDGLNFSYAWRIIPDLSFTGSTSLSQYNTQPKCYLSVRVRQNSGSAYTKDTDDPTNPYDRQGVTRSATYPVEQYTGQVYVRVRGRQMAFTIESFDLGVFWQMGMMRIDVRQDGRR